MKKKRISMFWYRITSIAAGFVARFIFRRKFIRNEIKTLKGPYVIIGNHQASLDFVNLMGATRRPITFVISNSFYNTLPVKGIMQKIGVIPKQQFQTNITDLKKMKETIDEGGILCIYPAGLMSEDGLSTPIPQGTYKFLKWLKADIYCAKTIGTYFAMPKWTKGMRRGRTYLDIYKLFDKEEIAGLDIPDIKKKTDEAILFDAYREQEKYLSKFKKNDNIEGLHNVLYMCPHCKNEFSIHVKDKSTLYCDICGYEETSDKYGFLHNEKEIGVEIRYPSDWSRLIYEELKTKIADGSEEELSCDTIIHTIDFDKNRYVETGKGVLTLNKERFALKGEVNGEELDIAVPVSYLASLPFKPGRHLELQHGNQIYRCVLSDGRLTMKYINTLKIHNELNYAKINSH
jgi:1-acyl-sn-glycerol-3-phosphate acyltransferase